MSNIPPGWYPDPENSAGERWWDGSKWTNRTSAASATVPLPPPASGWAQSAGMHSKKSTAGWALGLSIAGVFCCGPLSVAGLIMGKSEMNSVDSGMTAPNNRGLALAAFVIGIVGVSIWGLFLLFYVLAGAMVGFGS